MKIFRYGSYQEYERVQIETTLEKWSAGRGFTSHNRYITRLLTTMLLAGRPLPRDARVVCMGVRRGIELFVWEWKGFPNVAGVELAPVKGRPKVLTADFSDLRQHFADHSVDIIYATHSFEHSFDPRKTAQEWRRILKPGGAVWLAIPSGLGAADQDPSKSDPVLVRKVSDLEDLFAPFFVAWSEIERSGAYAEGRPVFNLNAIMLDSEQGPVQANRTAGAHTKAAIRRGWFYPLADRADALGMRLIKRSAGTMFVRNLASLYGRK
jgi:SAM-dependent methyltransferase